MKSSELFEAFSYVEDKYLNMVDTLEKESFEMKFENQHPIRRKTITLLIAAALCISLLATTALAAGWIPGIFNAMKVQEPMDEALYSAAAEANTDAVPEEWSIQQFDASKFTLFERYYDGETILLGYDMDVALPKATIGYIPDSETMDHIQNQIASYYDMGPSMKELCGDAYDEAVAIMDRDGYVCVVAYNAYVGDHILVNGHNIGEVLSEEVWSMRDDYEVDEGSCIRLNPLPEAGKNQDSVTVTLKIKSSEQYWYFDDENNCCLFKTDNHQEELVDFVLDNANK